ncbi:MAG: phytanoyl-CoA dioxygenase family protein [Kordiimonadaceae bacterium]|nr:phytanoyl-CoA dioxygenase family protein [Kordiimonadaceae bacterium]
MSAILNLLKLPYWVISPLTQAKSFKANPVIGSRILNLLGLHILRIIVARASMHFRWMLLSPMMPKKYRAAFHRDGFVVIENFISADDVKTLNREVASHTGPVREMMQGNTATQRFLLDANTLKHAPRLTSICQSPTLKRYLNYTGAKIAAPLLYVQRIRNGLPGKPVQGDGTDPQKNMHSDTFHPCMKAWLFFEDVTEDMGPFTYVPGSNRLTIKRLKWEYNRSIKAAGMTDKYSEKGSLRASPEDLKEMGLPAPTGITAKAGTLVIANTNGFHGRGAATEGASRLELWAYSRHNPFNPFPGIFVPFAKAIKNKAMHVFWDRADKKAQKKSAKASWYLIDPSDMLGDLSDTGPKHL